MSGGDPSDPAVGLQAQVEGGGYRRRYTAFTWASVLLVLGALVSAFLIQATKEDLPDEAVVHAADRGPGCSRLGALRPRAAGARQPCCARASAWSRAL